MKKYELLEDRCIEVYGLKLYRIRALRDFGDVKKGELGGYIQDENNLSHDGNAWVYINAWVYGDARVYGNAEIYGDVRVYDNAEIYGMLGYTTMQRYMGC